MAVQNIGQDCNLEPGFISILLSDWRECFKSCQNWAQSVILSEQRAKKVVSNSPGLVDFAIGLVNSVLNLPDGQAKIFRRIKITKVL